MRSSNSIFHGQLRSEAVRNAHSAELQMHCDAMVAARDLLQTALDTEEPDEKLQHLTTILVEKMGAYTSSAATLKKLIVSYGCINTCNFKHVVMNGWFSVAAPVDKLGTAEAKAKGKCQETCTQGQEVMRF